MKIGLRVSVNTLQGALQGVPNLLKLFDEYQVQATFFFAMGRDKSGRQILRHDLKPWLQYRNLSSRFYGTLLLPPDISMRAGAVMRSVAESGHEIGLLVHDPAEWVEKAAFADRNWTARQLRGGIEAFEALFQHLPQSVAAPGWQVNPALFELEQELGFEYATDVRGKSVCYPILQEVESRCPQIPTTLPTIRELLSESGGVKVETVHEYLYAESQYILPYGHVFALDAEIEGISLLPVMEKLVVMWRGYGEGLSPLGGLIDEEKRFAIEKHQIGWAPFQGGECHVATQSLRA